MLIIRAIAILVLVLPVFAKAQHFQSADTITPPANYENVYTRPLYSDSLVSSFVIFIKKEVKPHRHLAHSEHIYVLQGTGEMLLNKKRILVKTGDIVFIPKNTVHSLKVTSSIPVKVVSLQAPLFDGKDRIFTE